MLNKIWNFAPFKSDRAGSVLILALLLVLVIVPFCNLVFPEDSVFYVSNYTVSLLGKYFCYAMLAIALDLIWGYAGILSLGHSAFFALGGYAMGMYLMRQIGDRGVYGNAELPDFMVFLDWQSLPWYWQGFEYFWFALLMVVLIPGVMAFMFGWLAFRSRVTGVYFSIITQALTYALLLAFFQNDMGFGGNNGLTDFKDILGFSLQSPYVINGLFASSIIFLILSYYLCRAIVRSKTGNVLVAIRDAESRARFLGYRVENYKVFVFVVSAMIAGVAGAIYVPQVGIINPGEFSPINAIEIVVWVAIGGRGTLVGAIIGAILVNLAKTYFTGAFAEVWLFMLGALFVVSTLYLPNGIVGIVKQWLNKQSIKKATQTPLTANEV